jgi:hypothetical protein
MEKIEQILGQDEIYTETSDVKSMVILHKQEVFTHYDSGGTRHVFVNADKTKVIKLLVNKNGIDFNLDEFKRYENASDEHRAKMIPTTLQFGGLMVEQDFCLPISKGGTPPQTFSEILFAAACRDEVGRDKDGKLVCFDLDEYMRY